MTWRELKKLGIKRCDAYYDRSGRCRRRADAEATGDQTGYCRRCGPRVARALAPHLKAIREMNR